MSTAINRRYAPSLEFATLAILAIFSSAVMWFLFSQMLIIGLVDNMQNGRMNAPAAATPLAAMMIIAGAAAGGLGAMAMSLFDCDSLADQLIYGSLLTLNILSGIFAAAIIFIFGMLGIMTMSFAIAAPAFALTFSLGWLLSLSTI